MKKFIYILLVMIFVNTSCTSIEDTAPVPTETPITVILNSVETIDGCINGGVMVVGQTYSFQQVEKGKDVVATEVETVDQLGQGLVSVKLSNQQPLNLEPEGYLIAVYQFHTEIGEPVVEVDGKLYLVQNSCKQKINSN